MTPAPAQAGRGTWPDRADVDAWAAKAEWDAGLANVGALQLELALDVLTHRALADLAGARDPGSVSLAGRLAAPAPAPRRGVAGAGRARRRAGRHDGSDQTRQESALGRLFRLVVIIGTGILGVALAERAFFVFLLPPTETVLVVVAIELLFVYAGHRIGVRQGVWTQLDRPTRNVTRLIEITFLSAVVAVLYMRASVLAQDLADEAASVSLPVALWMFLSLGLLLAAVAIDAGLASKGVADALSTEWRLEHGSRTATQERQMLQAALRALHQRWLACQAAYQQAYVAHVPAELLPELDMVKPPEIPLDLLFDDDRLDHEGGRSLA